MLPFIERSNTVKPGYKKTLYKYLADSCRSLELLYGDLNYKTFGYKAERAGQVTSIKDRNCV